MLSPRTKRQNKTVQNLILLKEEVNKDPDRKEPFGALLERLFPDEQDRNDVVHALKLALPQSVAARAMTVVEYGSLEAMTQRIALTWIRRTVKHARTTARYYAGCDRMT